MPLGGGSWLARMRFSRRSILWFRSGMRAMICSSRWSAAARAAALLSGSCCMGWNQPPASGRDTAVSAAVPSSEALSHFPSSRRAMADVRRSPRAFSSAARSAAAPVAADAPAWAISTWRWSRGSYSGLGGIARMWGWEIVDADWFKDQVGAFEASAWAERLPVVGVFELLSEAPVLVFKFPESGVGVIPAGDGCLCGRGPILSAGSGPGVSLENIRSYLDDLERTV